jgi:protein-S-isoprenylcysteine O-methyltransferase Ste14
LADWSSTARKIRVPLGFAFAILYLWLARPTTFSLLCGLALVAPGLLLRAMASGHVRKNEQLATSGPYAHTRNPLYLGSLILAAGFAVAARSWWIAAALLIFFAAVYVPVIRGEEAFLRTRFPDFEDYARNVPGMFPRLTAYRREQATFSWELYKKHREYNSLLGAAVITLALLAKMIFLSS